MHVTCIQWNDQIKQKVYNIDQWRALTCRLPPRNANLTCQREQSNTVPFLQTVTHKKFWNFEIEGASDLGLLFEHRTSICWTKLKIMNRSPVEFILQIRLTNHHHDIVVNWCRNHRQSWGRHPCVVVVIIVYVHRRHHRQFKNNHYSEQIMIEERKCNCVKWKDVRRNLIIYYVVYSQSNAEAPMLYLRIYQLRDANF